MLRRLLRRQRPGSSAWVSAATAALVLTAAGLTIASPAHAVPFPVNDDFEGTPSSRWTTVAVPGITNVSLGNVAPNPRSGANVALLNAYPDAPATATIYRTITPDTAPTSDIQARIYLRRWAHAGENDPTVQVFLRIRQGGPTGRIISNKGRAIGATANWQLQTFHLFRPTGTFTVEISAYLGTVLVDDLSLTAA
jgi:hypothetical protein